MSGCLIILFFSGLIGLIGAYMSVSEYVALFIVVVLSILLATSSDSEPESYDAIEKRWRETHPLPPENIASAAENAGDSAEKDERKRDDWLL